MTKPHQVSNGTAQRFCPGDKQLILSPATATTKDFYFCQIGGRPRIGNRLRYKIEMLGSTKLPSLDEVDRREIEIGRGVGIDQAGSAETANLLIFLIGSGSSSAAAETAYRSAKLDEGATGARSAKTLLIELVANSANPAFDSISNMFVVPAQAGPRAIYLQTVTKNASAADIQEYIKNAWMAALGMSSPTSNHVP